MDLLTNVPFLANALFSTGGTQQPCKIFDIFVWYFCLFLFEIVFLAANALFSTGGQQQPCKLFFVWYFCLFLSEIAFFTATSLFSTGGTQQQPCKLFLFDFFGRFYLKLLFLQRLLYFQLVEYNNNLVNYFVWYLLL